MILGHQQAIKAIQYKNVGLQGEIRAKKQEITHLKGSYMDYLAKEDKTMALTLLRETMKQQGIPIICKLAAYQKSVAYQQHIKTQHRVLLTLNQGSTLILDGDTPNNIIRYNFG